MRILLAHPGTQHAFRLAAELEKRDLLGEFHTGLALPDGSLTARMAVRFRGASSRILGHVPASRLHTHPLNELLAYWQLRRGGAPEPIIHERNRRFQSKIADASISRHDAVIGFDTSAWDLARRANALSRRFYLDRTIAHPAFWLEMCRTLSSHYPEWFGRWATRPAYVITAEAEEHARAHRIVVGGTFARNTLIRQDIPADRIVVNHYGVDWDRFADYPLPDDRENRPLRFLFLGAVLARKGIPFLLDAWRSLGAKRRDAELWLVGPCDPPERRLIPELPGLRIRDRVPHSEIPALFAECDVFVLPSLLEGFGRVLLEALAAGLPIISTPNSGFGDMLLDPSLGSLVAVGDPESLAAALLQHIDRHPDRAAVRAAAAPLRAKFSWSAYGDRWKSILHESA